MPICPKCKKQELKSGEDLCPHCKNKRSHFWAKAGEVAVFVAVVVISIIFKKSSKA